MTEKILKQIEKQFLCGVQVNKINFENFLQDLKWDDQVNFMEHTILHPINTKYPLGQDYQLAFLKYVINRLENQGLEIHDSLYELLTQKLNEVKLTGNDFIHKHYVLDNDAIVTVKESSSFIRNGTTGLKVWQASLALSEFVMTHKDEFENKNVLELGSGMGLVGLVLLKTCSPNKIFLSDCHDSVLEILKENICINTSDKQIESIQSSFLLVQQRIKIENGPEIGIFNLPWEDIEAFEDDIPKLCIPDCILAADVVYDESLFEILITCIKKLFEIANNKTTMYLASTIRNETTYFGFKFLLEENGFHLNESDFKPEWFCWGDDSTPIQILKITHS